MPDPFESPEAIGQLDDLLTSVGLQHGSRRTRSGAWQNGERKRSPPPVARAEPAPPYPPELVQAPAWDRYPWLRHGFSTRAGGVSSIYGEHTLNLGWTPDDSPTNVAANRQRFANLVQHRGYAQTQSHKLIKSQLIGLRQIHSAAVRVIERTGDGTVHAEGSPALLLNPEGRPVLKGDALMTDVGGILLAVGAADCVPVLVADPRRKAVAAFHAGWRGTLARIVERGIGRMRLRYGSRPKDLVAAIGPSIGPCCYSVGEDVRFDFDSQFPYAPNLFSEVYDSDPVRTRYPLLFLTARAPGHSNIGPQIHLDLWEGNRRQLLDAGLKPAHITVVGECTACTRIGPDLKYFSHRGESGFAGRGLGAIGIAN